MSRASLNKNHRKSEGGKADLSSASHNDRKRAVDESWIHGKVDVNLRDKGGATSLLRASNEGHTDIAQSSKPEEMDNARELRRSDISQCMPVELCVKYIKHNMTSMLLGTGAFGNAYLGEDKALSTKFVVKEIKFTRNDQTAIDEIRRGFQQEISAFTTSHHPNFLSLYGFSLNVDHIHQYLVYELPINGPLSNFLRDGGNKSPLTPFIRLSIMCGLTRAIRVLHKYGRSSSSSFHRDIQSANIYLTEDFTAQLMDCGLSKFVPIDNNHSTTMLVMNYSPGSRVYMDPKFFENTNTSQRYSYQAEYDVYSIGIVMIELIVGFLIGHQTSKHETKHSFVFHHCVEEMAGNPVPNRLEELKKSADSIYRNQKALDLVCDAAIRCTKPTAVGRNTTKNLLLTLREAAFGCNTDVDHDCEERECLVCLYNNSSRTCNNGHAVCPRCIERQIQRGFACKSQQVCPMRNCQSSDDYLYGYISFEVFDLYMVNRYPQKTFENHSVM